MKKITFKLFAILAMTLSSIGANAQFGCGSAVVITNGFTASGITTPGNGGLEDWNTNPDPSSINSSYYADDVYLFQYTAGSTAESISITTFSRNAWNGLGIFTTCSGDTFSGELAAQGSTGTNATKTLQAVVSAGQTVYIATGQWGTPNGLDFDVLSFTSTQLSAPNCGTLTAPTANQTNVNPDGTFTWTATPLSTGYKLSLGTTPGGTDVLNLMDVGNVLTYNFPGVLNSNTAYYVTLYPYNSVGTATGCTEVMFTTGAPPANDDCAGAISLLVNPTLACDSTTASSTVNASQSMPAAPCGGTPNDDVWFKFVATATLHKVSLVDVLLASGTSTDLYFQVLSGTCGNMTSLVCSDPNSADVSGLTVGETYYVRVYSYYTSSRVNFSICIGTPPAPPTPPVNDDCAGAITVPVNADYNCANVVSATTAGATSSMAAAPCSGNANDDVWFKFVATNVEHAIAISNKVLFSGTNSDMYFQVFSGTCTATTSLLCSDPDTNIVSGLTPGETYLIRVYTYGSTSRVNFDLCVTTGPTPPANDECAGAVTLTVNPTFNCTTVTPGTTAGATMSMAATPCTGTPSDDVWYKFVALAPSQKVTISNKTFAFGTSNDMYFQVLSGTCDATLTSLLCSDPDTNTVNGLTVGETYYVRVYTYSTTSRVNYDICVSTDPALSATSFTSSKLSFYPNPVQNVLNISNAAAINTVALYNMLGQQVLKVNANSTEVSVDMTSLPAGTYIVRTSSDNASDSFKVQKQ